MHNFVKTAAVFGLFAAVTACSGGIKMETVDKSYQADTIFADAKVPKITGLADENAEAEINSEYEDKIGTLLEEFSKEAKETGDKSTFTVTTTEHTKGPVLYSAVSEIESCPAANRKTKVRIANTVDVPSGRRLALSDLFEGDGYIDALNTALSELVDSTPEKYTGLWEKPRLREGQDFYLTDKELILYYPPYELSYYERGFVEFPISLESLSGYLKECYRK